MDGCAPAVSPPPLRGWSAHGLFFNNNLTDRAKPVWVSSSTFVACQQTQPPNHADSSRQDTGHTTDGRQQGGLYGIIRRVPRRTLPARPEIHEITGLGRRCGAGHFPESMGKPPEPQRRPVFCGLY